MAKFKYTEEQDEWLKENAKRFVWVDLAEEFNKRFGINKNFRTLKTHCNSVLKCSPQLCGHEKGQNVWNKRPIRSEYTAPNGYTYVKISDNPVTRNTKHRTAVNWKAKQVLVWEKHNKRNLPVGFAVSFLDGDKTNFDINNLIALPISTEGKLGMFKQNCMPTQINKIFALSQYQNDILHEILERRDNNG